MCFELDGVRLLQLQDSERRNNMSAEGGSLPAMWGCVRTIGAVSPRSRRLSLMDLNRGTSGTTLTLHWGGLGVKACGADCTRDRLCTDASGLLGVFESASNSLGRSIADFPDRLGGREKRLEKNPFCAFAIGSVLKSARAGTLMPGDVGGTIEDGGCWESRSAWLISFSRTWRVLTSDVLRCYVHEAKSRGRPGTLAKKDNGSPRSEPDGQYI
jgi:hypothetical protein